MEPSGNNQGEPHTDTHQPSFVRAFTTWDWGGRLGLGLTSLAQLESTCVRTMSTCVPDEAGSRTVSLRGDKVSTWPLAKPNTGRDRGGTTYSNIVEYGVDALLGMET